MSLGKVETELTPDEVSAVLNKEASSTRWPIAVSLVENEEGLTATNLAQIVGKSISWTLKQAKAMEEEKILAGENDLLDLPRGRVYKLAVGSEAVKQCKEYEAVRKSLARGKLASGVHANVVHAMKPRLGETPDGGPSLMEFVAEFMALDADAAMIGYGFIPVRVTESGDGVEYVPIDKEAKAVIVADTFPKFGKIMGEVLGYSGASAPMLRALPQTDQSE